MNFSYVDIVGDKCNGWLNLFFGEHCIALVNNVKIANEMRRVIPKKTNKPAEPTADTEPIPCAVCGHVGDHVNCIYGQ